MTKLNYEKLRSGVMEALLIAHKEQISSEDQEKLQAWRESLSPELVLRLIQEAEHPKLVQLSPEQVQDVAQVESFAARVLRAQDITQGSVAMYNSRDGKHAIPALHVAAVLHALADFTHNQHMVNVIVDQEILARGDEIRSFAPRASSLGRYFHRLADAIEWKELEREQDTGVQA